MTTANNDDVTAVTAHGDDVTEITVHGDVVWTASQVSAPYDDAIHDWRITEGSGSTLTDSVGSEDLSLPNGATWVSDANHYDDTAVEFDGSTQYAEGSSMNMQPPFTVVIEFAAVNPDDGNFGPVPVGEGRTVSGGGSRAQWACNHLSSGEYYVEVIDDTETEHLISSSTPATGVVYKNGIRIDGDGLGNIFDGTVANETGTFTASDTINTSSNPFTVGRDAQRDDWYLEGRVGRVTIWDRALTDTEVTNL